MSLFVAVVRSRSMLTAYAEKAALLSTDLLLAQLNDNSTETSGENICNPGVPLCKAFLPSGVWNEIECDFVECPAME
eukprot:9164626-Pyramimonas_sp.AAC.3